MMAKYEIKQLPSVVVDDPEKLAWIDGHMERAKPGKKRRPTGGRVVHMWVNSQQQARLAELAEQQQVSLNIAAKRVLEEALERRP